MNVEIGTKAPQFSEKEYIIGISVAVQVSSYSSQNYTDSPYSSF